MLKVQPGARPEESKQVSEQLLQGSQAQNVQYGDASAGRDVVTDLLSHRQQAVHQ